MGLIEADTPVIPEFFEFKMEDLAAAENAKAGLKRRAQARKLPSTLTMSVCGIKKSFDIGTLVSQGFNEHRNGKDLWNLLQPRLKMLLAMRRDWGNIDDIYGHSDSSFGQVPLPWSMRDPDSGFSAVWDVMQVVFLFYVSWTVPLRACFGVESTVASPEWFMDLVVDLYFISDRELTSAPFLTSHCPFPLSVQSVCKSQAELVVCVLLCLLLRLFVARVVVLNFFTAFVDGSGVRQSSRRVVTRTYLRGWFTIDFLSCIPVQYIALIFENNNESRGSDYRVFKVLRLVRLSKMLRLARIKRMLEKYESMEFIQNYGGIAMLSGSIIFTSHILACLWYMIGLSDHHATAELVTPGWVLQEWCRGQCDLGSTMWSKAVEQHAVTNTSPGLCRSMISEATCNAIDDTDRCAWSGGRCSPRTYCEIGCEQLDERIQLSRRYVAALWMVFGSIDPDVAQTDPERAFAVFAYICLVMIDGAVAGVLSAVMISMGGKEREVNERLRSAKQWMREQRIPKTKASKALDYFRLVYKSRVMYEETEILSTMPPAVRVIDLGIF